MSVSPPPVSTAAPTPTAASLTIAHNLVGVDLPDGWKVIRKVAKHHSATGGHFSVSYVVEHTSGKQAFLKVLDLGRALLMPGDQLVNIQNLITQFNFERETLRVCRNFALKRVASAITDGKLDVPTSSFGVYYIIFELAEGDIRKQLSTMTSMDLPWMLRTLHQTAVGIGQLHKKDIAHQDLKPSNVLVYGPRDSKVADLGCADIKDNKCPRGHYEVAGDLGYAPPELLYGDVSPDWERRRLGTDMYLFGSLVAFLFTQVSMTQALIANIHPPHRPGMWPHDYRNVLPYVRHAFGQTIAAVRTALPEPIRDELGHAVELLCDPDPQLRGHPKDIGSAQFNFQRFVSLFDKLATRAEFGLLKI